MDVDESADGRRYRVVINDEEQYSIWPKDGMEIPAGWRATGFSGEKEACLAHIAEVWTDLRPRSLRERMGV
ncbi:MbtH family NRPS accessory protein [Kibdelosporangium lantanae]